MGGPCCWRKPGPAVPVGAGNGYIFRCHLLKALLRWLWRLLEVLRVQTQVRLFGRTMTACSTSCSPWRHRLEVLRVLLVIAGSHSCDWRRVVRVLLFLILKLATLLGHSFGVIVAALCLLLSVTFCAVLIIFRVFCPTQVCLSGARWLFMCLICAVAFSSLLIQNVQQC